MNKIVLWVGALFVIPLLFFLAIGFRFDPHTIESPLIGKPAPQFALLDLDGRKLDLAELAGQPVVINFWASWCQPCVVEHPMLVEAARLYEGKVHFLGIVYQDEVGAIEQFLALRGTWGPALIDPGSRVAIAYGVYGVPETYIVDADGMVAHKITGLLSWKALTGVLEELI